MVTKMSEYLVEKIMKEGERIGGVLWFPLFKDIGFYRYKKYEHVIDEKAKKILISSPIDQKKTEIKLFLDNF